METLIKGTKYLNLILQSTFVTGVHDFEIDNTITLLLSKPLTLYDILIKKDYPRHPPLQELMRVRIPQEVSTLYTPTKLKSIHLQDQDFVKIAFLLKLPSLKSLSLVRCVI
jgi:hypothetical protein